MAKQYNQNDFNHVVCRVNREPISLPSANDEVTRVYGPEEQYRQSAEYLERFRVPGIANDDRVEHQERAEALSSEFTRLETLRGSISEKRYQEHRAQLSRGLLTMCRDPGCGASPTSKKNEPKKTPKLNADGLSM